MRHGTCHLTQHKICWIEQNAKAKPVITDLAAGSEAHSEWKSYTSIRESVICDFIDMGATYRRDLAKPCQGYLAATPLQRTLPGSLGCT